MLMVPPCGADWMMWASTIAALMIKARGTRLPVQMMPTTGAWPAATVIPFS
ncbi:MAG: hypothetical protein JXK94_13935 [Deltaproteobacteria bacterium]|nr:hypothetical protein [Deltaproteobacteria bacterium]